MKHHGIDFGVEKKPPSWWHWKIYSKIKASPAVVGNMKFQTRAAAIAACSHPTLKFSAEVFPLLGTSS